MCCPSILEGLWPTSLSKQCVDFAIGLFKMSISVTMRETVHLFKYVKYHIGDVPVNRVLVAIFFLGCWSLAHCLFVL